MTQALDRDGEECQATAHRAHDVVATLNQRH